MLLTAEAVGVGRHPRVVRGAPDPGGVGFVAAVVQVVAAGGDVKAGVASKLRCVL